MWVGEVTWGRQDHGEAIGVHVRQRGGEERRGQLRISDGIKRRRNAREADKAKKV